MKFFRFVVVISILLLTSLLQAQQVNPTSLSFESVPPNPTPQEGLVFKNTGTTQLTLSFQIAAPFVISENECENGVKPGTHCNLYLTYTAQTVGEQDAGTLTINYGSGSVGVPLSGSGVANIATDIVHDWSQHPNVRLGHFAPLGATMILSDQYYYPDGVGESVTFSCSSGSATASGTGGLELCSGGGCHYKKHRGIGERADGGVTPTQTGDWSCTVSYPGDNILGPSSADGPTFHVF